MDERPVVIVGYENAELLEIACVSSSLDAANRVGATPPYAVRVATPGGHPITCHSGLTLQSHISLERLTGPLDTIVVAGGFGSGRASANPRIVGHVRRLAAQSRRVASVCTGMGVLAAAGLLDGKRATTHWGYADLLAARHPTVKVDPGPIYIRDGKVSTAAGVTSALDLTLAFVEEDHGAELARLVARALVTYLQRPGTQAQMSMFVAAPPAGHGLVRQVVDRVHRELDRDLTTATLATGVGVSERHLSRLFSEHLGQTPGRFVRQARIEAATQLLVSTALPMTRVADRCGFGSTEALRQAFISRYGISPARYRTANKTALSR